VINGGLADPLGQWEILEKLDMLYLTDCAGGQQYEAIKAAELFGLAVINAGTSYDSIKTVPAHSNATAEARAFQLMFTFVNATSILMIEEGEGLLRNELKANGIEVSNYLKVVNDTTDNSLSLLTIRQVKPSGIKHILIDAEAALAGRILKTMNNSKMLKKDISIYLSSRASSFPKTLNYTGLITVSETAALNASSAIDYDLNTIREFGSSNCPNSTCKTTNLQMANQYLAYTATKGLVVSNMVGGSFKRVGMYSNGDLKIEAPIVFVGGMLTAPTTELSTITMTLNSGNNNPDGTVEPTNSFYQSYAKYAFKVMNQDKVLYPFQVKVHEVSCGATVAVPAFIAKCLLEAKSEIGIGFFPSSSSPMTIVLHALMNSLGINSFLIGCLIQVPILSSTKDFPFVIRMMTLTTNVLYPIVLFFKSYGYNSVNIIYSNDLYGLPNFTVAKQIFEKNGITIANSEASQAIEPDLAASRDCAKYSDFFTGLLSSGVRPTFFIAVNTFQSVIVDCLYQLGASAEDLILLYSVMTFNLLVGASEADIARRKTFIHQQFNVFQSSFAGELGKKVEADATKEFGIAPVQAQSIFYDGALFATYTVKSMILRGLDFEDRVAFGAELRKNSVIGTTGRIKIEENSNDRKTMDVDFFNVIIDENDTHTTIKFMTIDLSSSKFITTYGVDPVWNTGSTTPPPQNTKNYDGCPFPEEERHDFEEGKQLMVYLACFYFILAFISTFLSFKKHMKINFTPLTERSEISYHDYMVALIISVEAVQYITYSPTFPGFTVNGVFDISQFGFSYLNKVTFVIIAVFAWMFMCFIVYSKHANLLTRFNLDLILLAAELVQPILGNIFFMPFLAIMFDLYACTEAAGPDKDSLTFEDSFLDRDCDHYCWNGTHLTLAIIAALALSLYITIAIYVRPSMQEFLPMLHVKSNPKYYVCKSLFQVFLILIKRVLKEDYMLSYSFVYLGVFTVYLLLSLVKDQYNYKRMSLLHNFSLAVVLWYGVLSVSHKMSELEMYVMWITLFMFGFVVMSAFSVYRYARHPSLLYSIKNKHMNELLTFAFSFNSKVPAYFTSVRLNFYSDLESRTLNLTKFD